MYLPPSRPSSPPSINPDYHDALMNLATLMADQGRVEEGWPHMQRAAAVARDNADVHNNLAAYLLRMGEELHSSFPTCTIPDPEDKNLQDLFRTTLIKIRRIYAVRERL